MSSALNFVGCALCYEGKLSHVPTSMEFSAYSSLDGGRVGNDFLLQYAKNLGIVPRKVRDDVLSRHDAILHHKQDGSFMENPLRMNCWDFCLLVLEQAGLINADQIDQLCCIVKLRGPTAVLVEALYQEPIKQYRVISDTNLPRKGDLVLLQRNRELLPWHAEICVGEGGENIRLLGRGGCSKRKFELHPELSGDSPFAENAYIIPFHEIVSNIENYIEKNRSILNEACFPLLSEREVFNALPLSYKELLTSEERQLQMMSPEMPSQPASLRRIDPLPRSGLIAFFHNIFDRKRGVGSDSPPGSDHSRS